MGHRPVSTECFLIGLVLYGSSALAGDVTGKVIGIADGDTIKVLSQGREVKVRLHGIDCPEKGQAFGNRAKQAASALVFGKEVTLQTYGLDKYGRTIAEVLLPDRTNVNHELVKDGWCWWYRKYAPGDAVLAGLEKDARGAKKGLWADPKPVPPWEWRKRHYQGVLTPLHGPHSILNTKVFTPALLNAPLSLHH